jgi:hypothetical protein
MQACADDTGRGWASEVSWFLEWIVHAEFSRGIG